MPVFVLPTLNETLLTAWLDAHYGMKLATFSALPLRHGRAYFRLTTDKGERLLLVVQPQPFSLDLVKTWQALYYDYGIQQIQPPPLRAKTGSYDTLLEGAHALLMPDIEGKPAASLTLDAGQRKQIGMLLAKLHGCKLLNEEKLPQETFDNPFAAAWQALAATTPASLATTPAPLATTPASLAPEPAPTASSLEDTQPSAVISDDNQPTEKLVALVDAAGSTESMPPLLAPSSDAAAPPVSAGDSAPASPVSAGDSAPAPKADTPAHPLAADWDALHAYYTAFAAACQRHSTNSALRKRFVACHADVNGNTLLQNNDAQWRLVPCDTLMLAPAERDLYQLAPLEDYMVGYHRLHESFTPDEELLAYYRQRDALVQLFALLQSDTPDADALSAWCAAHLQPNSRQITAAT